MRRGFTEVDGRGRVRGSSNALPGTCPLAGCPLAGAGGTCASYSIALLIVSTMYFTSSSLTYGPAGKHIPTLKMASLTPFT